ncbi:uncharacterized protein B0T23DRAFT_325101, partial [Neurospora hispaniola]
FPSLYPYKQGEYFNPRIKKVNYDKYIQYIIRWYNGRFTQYEQFQYITFNSLIYN